MPKLAGKVAVVTGASSGIGWALAKQLAADGCTLGLIARRAEPLAELAAQLPKAAFATADVSDRVQVDAAVAALRQQLGPIDLAFANAGVGMPTLLDPVNVADVEAMIRVNVLGVVYLCAAVMPEMLKRKSGHLVGVSSLAGYRALPGESAYCASRTGCGVSRMSRSRPMPAHAPPASPTAGYTVMSWHCVMVRGAKGDATPCFLASASTCVR